MTFLNPIYPHTFPDPFVLKYLGEYWAYCTGFQPDGRCFGVLHSLDLVHWRAVGSAMDPLPGGAPCYWAPEVLYDNGLFFMYYSVGDEAHMQIRAAVAHHPAGPFVDSGSPLTTEPFAIDAHPFQDEDGSRYLFYATDFLDHTHIGTGTVCDRMIGPFKLAGQPQPVTLPHFDWQVYDARRVEKGGVRWHTVEGPFVVKHKGRYYQMFSGGNWRNTSYGVGYGSSDDIEGGHEWQQACDGKHVPPILHTLPGRVIGPGHNSVVLGPDNLQLYCVYHCWVQDGADRVMAIDRLDWAGERMLVWGPTDTPQPGPHPPTCSSFENTGASGMEWEYTGGQWAPHHDSIIQSLDSGTSQASLKLSCPCFVLQVSLAALGAPGANAYHGIALASSTGQKVSLSLAPETRQIVLAAGPHRLVWELPAGFSIRAYHLLRMVANDRRISLCLEGTGVHWEGSLDEPASSVTLFTHHMAAAWAGFGLTLGWQDTFEQADLAGWQAGPGDAWRIADSQLVHPQAGDSHALIQKPVPLDDYEVVVNARLDAAGLDGCYGFYPAMSEAHRGPLVAVERHREGWAVVAGENQAHVMPLPSDLPPGYQQFRFRKQDGRLVIQWQTHELGEIAAPRGKTWVGLYAHQAQVAFDMVRVTAIPAS